MINSVPLRSSPSRLINYFWECIYPKPPPPHHPHLQQKKHPLATYSGILECPQTKQRYIYTSTRKRIDLVVPFREQYGCIILLRTNTIVDKQSGNECTGMVREEVDGRVGHFVYFIQDKKLYCWDTRHSVSFSDLEPIYKINKVHFKLQINEETGMVINTDERTFTDGTYQYEVVYYVHHQYVVRTLVIRHPSTGKEVYRVGLSDGIGDFFSFSGKRLTEYAKYGGYQKEYHLWELERKKTHLLEECMPIPELRTHILSFLVLPTSVNQ